LVIPHDNALNFNTGLSIFAVYKWTGGTTWSALMGKDSYNETSGWQIIKTTVSSMLFARGGLVDFVEQTSIVDDTDMISAISNSSDLYSYMNGDNYQTDTLTISDNTYELKIGCRNGNGGTGTKDAWDGDINEIVIVTGEVSTETRQKIEGYLAWKWGLVANLPGGHPYKSAPPTA